MVCAGCGRGYGMGCRGVMYRGAAGILLMCCWLLPGSEAVADSVSAPVSAAARPPQQWYACPQGEKRAVYVTQPVDVRCQPARQPPQQNELDSIHSDNEDLQRLWYMREFAYEQDVTVLSKSAPPVNVHLRQQTPEPRAASAPVKRAAPVSVPVRKIVPPRPLTPKQLIQRDLAKEQRALSVARQQWQQARKQANAAKVKQWQQNISDRQANIQALRQELNRY